MMIEDLLTLLPTPMMLPPTMFGVSPSGTCEGSEPVPWSALTGAPVVPGAVVPGVVPGTVPGAVPLGCDPFSPCSAFATPAPKGEGELVLASAAAGVPK